LNHRAFGLLIILVAISAPAAAFRYHIRTYGEAEGLSNQAVFGVNQTDDGRIWLATRKGLEVFDGSVWTHVLWGFDNTGSGLRDVVVDEEGRLWIANLLTPARVSWFEEGNWHHLPPPPVQSWEWNLVQFDVAIDDEGNTWVVVSTSDDRVAVWDGRAWVSHGFSETLDRVHDVLHRDGEFLLATERGLWALPMVPGAMPRSIPGREQRPCFALSQTDDGGVWVVEDRSAALIDPDGGESRYEIPLLAIDERSRLACAAATRRGELWVGTPSLLVFFDPERGGEILSRESGLADDGAATVFIDREENVWVGTMRGLSKIVSRQVRTLDRSHGLLDDEVSAILRLRNGRMVIGHEHGATILDPWPQIVRVDVLPHIRSRFMDMVEDRDGVVWVALDRHGLARMTPDGKIVQLRPPMGPPNETFSVLIDDEGTLWVGGYDGLGRLVDGRYERVELPGTRGGRQPLVRRLAASSDGGIYAASGVNGVHYVDEGVLRSWTEAPVPGALRTYCVLERPTGAVWVGTSVGVYRLGQDRLEPVDALAPILDRPVYAMEPDASGRVWFGTDEGVRVWNGEELRSIRSGDGLRGSEVNRDGLWLDRDGSMWVGTERGVTRFEKDYIGETDARPLVEFLGFDINGTSVPVGEVSSLRGPISTLVARFRGISLVDEDRIRFRTWLEGFEESWQPLRRFHFDRCGSPTSRRGPIAFTFRRWVCTVRRARSQSLRR